MKIYTKTGDQGETSMVGGTRIPKSSKLLDAYGTVDELNAFVGALILKDDQPFLTEIQQMLFVVGGMLATQPEAWSQYWKVSDVADFTQTLEARIDELSAALEPAKGFILPQGDEAIVTAHQCRTICRRAERQTAVLCDQNEVYFSLLKLLNRLSDFFYILARFYHKKNNIPETIWKSKK